MSTAFLAYGKAKKILVFTAWEPSIYSSIFHFVFLMEHGYHCIVQSIVTSFTL